VKAYPGGRTTISTILAVGTTLAVLLAGGGGPSAHASASRPAKATLVYFIFTGFTYPYFAPMAQGVTAAAKQYPNLNIKTVSAGNSASRKSAISTKRSPTAPRGSSSIPSRNR
jgi:ABC-type sugar transport system substrate-binding protein